MSIEACLEALKASRSLREEDALPEGHKLRETETRIVETNMGPYSTLEDLRWEDIEASRTTLQKLRIAHAALTREVNAGIDNPMDHLD